MPKMWPEPTVDAPEPEDIRDWIMDVEYCQATDGCDVEPDGVCPDGHPSWLLVLGLI